MSGQATRSIYFDEKVTGGGQFEVTATCAMGMVNFAYDYFPEHKGDSDGPSWLENESYSGTTFGFSTELSHNVTRWVPIRIRLDQGEVLERNSSSKFNNEVEVVFYDPQRVQRLAEAYASATPDGRDAGKAIAGMMQAFEYQLLPGLMPSIAGGTLDQLERANTLRVQVPLTDGRKPVVTIHPDSAGLKAFVAECGGSRAPHGRYTGPQGLTMDFKSGAATISQPGKPDVSVPYEVVGATVTLMFDRAPHLSAHIDGDSSLQFGSGIRLTPAP